MNDYPVVLVRWEDSHGLPNGWCGAEDTECDEPVICESVGWLVRDSPRAIIVVPHYHPEHRGGDSSIGGDMQIPRSAIVHLQELEPGRFLPSKTPGSAA